MTCLSSRAARRDGTVSLLCHPTAPSHRPHPDRAPAVPLHARVVAPRTRLGFLRCAHDASRPPQLGEPQRVPAAPGVQEARGHGGSIPPLEGTRPCAPSMAPAVYPSAALVFPHPSALTTAPRRRTCSTCGSCSTCTTSRRTKKARSAPCASSWIISRTSRQCGCPASSTNR